MKRIVLITLGLSFLLIPVWGQLNTCTVSGRVIERTTDPLQNVTLLVLSLPDSSYITGTVTDLDGMFQLEDIPKADCLLEVSILGFGKKYIELSAIQGGVVNLGDIKLDEDSYLLNNIVVTANRPQIRMDAGKTVVNISASILGSQGNVIDALKNLPGVIVREDGSIYLNGQAGVNVLINDKQTYLSGENLLNLLRSISSATVDKIELITHPSSRYDAAGNAGLINIQTKKVRLQGISLSATSNVQQGKYAKGNENLSLTMRKDKFNFYVDYSWYRGKDDMLMNSYRWYVDPLTSQSEEGVQLTEADRKVKYQSHYIRGGIDYDLSDRITLGTYVTSNWHSWRKNEVTMTDFVSGTQSDSILTTQNRYTKYNTNLTGGVNIDYNPGEAIKWDAAFDLQLFSHDDNIAQQSVFRSPPSWLQRDTLDGKVVGSIDIYTSQTNFVYNFPERFRLSAGAKTSFVKVENDANYRDLRQGIWHKNDGLSGLFSYKENINAFYTQLDAQWNEVISTEIGLRVENTHIKGWQQEAGKDSTFRQNYTHLFPTGIVRFQPAEDHGFSFLYGRRIIRPNYRDLNPFVEISDRYLHEQGNTELNPELTNNVEVSYFLKRQYGITLFYSYRKHPVTKSYLLDDEGIIIVTPLNLSSNHMAGVRVGLNNLQPFAWWTCHINAAATYKQFQWDALGVTEESKRITPMVHVSNQLMLPMGWGAELTGFYNGKMTEGQALVHPLWMLSAGLKKNILKNKASISIYANDIFKSNQPKIDIRSPLVNGWYKEKTDSRNVGITFTYRFNSGSNTKDSRPDNRIDESKRINL